MTDEMLALARENQQKAGVENVQWLRGQIEEIPLPADTVDVVISNCVINLSPDKPQVWREIARVLKPGGRVAVSDLALLRPLPEALTRMPELLIGCVAGAALVDDTARMIREAGLTDARLAPRPEYIRTMARLNDPFYQRIIPYLPAETTVADFVTSLSIEARQPAACCCGSGRGA
jgi:SAM-dependent methyltransferase